MRKLRKVVDLGGIDRVYAVAMDRVTRSMRDAILLMDEFERAVVEVRFAHQPELTFGAQGRLLVHVMAAFADFERDMIATRIAEEARPPPRGQSPFPARDLEQVVLGFFDDGATPHAPRAGRFRVGDPQARSGRLSARFTDSRHRASPRVAKSCQAGWRIVKAKYRTALLGHH